MQAVGPAPDPSGGIAVQVAGPENHALLAAHAGTIMGVETNAMQFYPEASRLEATVHPGLYQRRGGTVDLSTLGGNGFGYRINEIPARPDLVAA